MLLDLSFLDLSEVRLHYRGDGEEDRPVLVLSHGLGTNLTMWDAQVPEFSRSFRVLRYDQRGHGESSAPPGPYSLEQLGRDVVELLDRLDIERCFFCGISMGGMVGQWLGVHAADRVRKLVLCDTAPRIGSVESWNARIEAVSKDGVEPLVAGSRDRWFTQAFQQRFPSEVARAGRMLESTDPSGYIAACAVVRDADLREEVSGIRLPTLVVTGAHDLVTTPAEGRHLAEAIPGARYVELQAAHLANMEAVEEFSSAVREFLLA